MYLRLKIDEGVFQGCGLVVSRLVKSDFFPCFSFIVPVFTTVFVKSEEKYQNNYTFALNVAGLLCSGLFCMEPVAGSASNLPYIVIRNFSV